MRHDGREVGLDEDALHDLAGAEAELVPLRAPGGEGREARREGHEGDPVPEVDPMRGRLALPHPVAELAKAAAPGGDSEQARARGGHSDEAPAARVEDALSDLEADLEQAAVRSHGEEAAIDLDEVDAVLDLHARALCE